MGRAGHKWSALGIISISLALRQDFPGFGSVPFQVVWTATGISVRVFHPEGTREGWRFSRMFPSRFLSFPPIPDPPGCPAVLAKGLNFGNPDICGHFLTFV